MQLWVGCWLAAVFALAVQADSDDPQVTCGSVVKLAHDSTKYLLHSHEIAYGSGSGQQSVTGSDSNDDANSLWIVRGVKDAPCAQGIPIKSGFHLRLQHAATRKFLHSHHFASPLSGNQEVSAFGGDQDSDDGDVWQVDWDKAVGEWGRDQKVRLRHVQTGVYLASSTQRYSRPISGQQEIFGRGKTDVWVATEGVYFPSR